MLEQAPKTRRRFGHYVNNFIGGEFITLGEKDKIELTNPSTGELICTVWDSISANVERALLAAKVAQLEWENRPAIELANVLHATAAKILQHAASLARTIAEEKSKFLALVRVEVSFTADYFDYMAEWTPCTGVGEHAFWKSATGRIRRRPLINEAGSPRVDCMVQRAIKVGATLVTSGKRGHDQRGHYYKPTVLTDCRQEMEIFQREIFGPVVPIVTFESLDESIAYTNDAEYGLTSSIYESSFNVAMKACQQIRFKKPISTARTCGASTPAGASVRIVNMGLYAFLETHIVYMQRC
jgi:acyl-CoA reductase-like NAD-dependent aldehyde dehydrogenase